MTADKFISWILFTVICLFFLFGCVPSKTEFYLTKYNYLSSWAQGVGSLLAVWATYNVYRISSEEQRKRESRRDQEQRDREIKKDQEQREYQEKIAAEQERKNRAILELEGKVLFLSNEHLRLWMSNIDHYLNHFAANETVTDIYDLCVRNCTVFRLQKIEPLDNSDFENLARVFGRDIIEMQRLIILLEGFYRNVEFIVHNIEELQKHLTSFPEDEEYLQGRIDYFNSYLLGQLIEARSNNDLLKSHFMTIKHHAIIYLKTPG